jgi:hypothetical protein
MEPLTVDPSGTHFIVGGSFVPLIIDTAWSSFADPSEDEWRMYLSARRRQGFTCVLVSVLPILHDRDERPTAREPFALDAAGHHDFARLDDRFFATAREFTRIAHEEYGLRLMIGVCGTTTCPARGVPRGRRTRSCRSSTGARTSPGSPRRSAICSRSSRSAATTTTPCRPRTPVTGRRRPSCAPPLAFPGALDISLMARLFVDHRWTGSPRRRSCWPVGRATPCA